MRTMVLGACFCLSATAAANMMPPLPPPVTVEIHAIDALGVHAKIGWIELKETSVGLMFFPQLKGLPPGARGFHIHEKGDCRPGAKNGVMVAGLAAGSHFDPDGHGKHLGPKGSGHRGDLNVLTVAADGTATQSIVSNRLKLKDIAGRSIMIHSGGDNYSDQPEPLGGGGARIACGVVPVTWDGREPKETQDDLSPSVK